MRASGDFALRNVLPASRRIVLLAAMAVAPIALSACHDLNMEELSDLDLRGPATTRTIQEPDDNKFRASDEPYRLGVEQFNRGYYGKAEQYFQEAIEKSPQDVEAWISIAACYDHLRRFDFADKAYGRAIELGGVTVQLLNNQGYSYVLRGDLRTARAKFSEALRRDPDNVMVQNNLRRLELSEMASHGHG
jgi:Flp pilus assembly protein TadD